MLRKLRERIHNGQEGFTLIELLVVILIIGILAAIALPAFLGQRAKGQDSEAKSNVRNLVSHMESCFTTEESYADCDASNTDIASSGIEIGSGPGEVADLGPRATMATRSSACRSPTRCSGTSRTRSQTPAVTKSCTLDHGCNNGTW